MKDKTNNLQFHPMVQTTSISYEGVILTTDENLFDWAQGSSIFEEHPFFEIIRGYDHKGVNNSNELHFPCIHLETEKTERICDVSIVFEPSEIFIYLYDYTNKYRELNQIAQDKNESILLSRNLELENRYLLEKEEFKNSFIANINHEIRTPLTGILGFVEVLEKTELNFEQEELTRIIKRESLYLNSLIDDMIDISKIESGKLKVEEERFSFLNMINGFRESYSKIAKEKGLKFETKVDDNIQEYLIGDRTRIYQILNNLISNAFKFTEEGKVSLIITKNYQRTNKLSLNFKIQDTGIGIEKEDIPELFNRFSRFSQDRQIPGTGLGLAIVKNLVELLQGEIKVDSTLQKGTTFNIKLPFKFTLTKTTPEKKRKKYSLPDHKSKFRILVVEDEEVTQYLVIKILIATGNYFVDIANDGEEAIKAIERRKYDLILMDLTVSKIDGFKTTQMIRKNYGDKFISDVPIIGFSGKSDENSRDQCIRAGMDDFIAKPFEQEDLMYKIVKQIAKKAAN